MHDGAESDIFRLAGSRNLMVKDSKMSTRARQPDDE